MINLPDYGIFEDYRVTSYLPVNFSSPTSIYFGLTLTRFGLIHWINAEVCPLSDSEKQLLHFFRSNEFNVTKMVRNTGLHKKISEQKITELGNRLVRAYPNYQRWLETESKKDYLQRETELNKYLFLNLPFHKLGFISTQGISALKRANIPSMLYLLQTHSCLQIMTKNLLTVIENELLYRKLCQCDCAYLWELDTPFYAVFANFLRNRKKTNVVK